MTEKLYDIDSHIKEFTALIKGCYAKNNGYAVILDKTAFFPEGGGQASDTGFIGRAEVYDVQIENDEILHYIKEPLAVGEEVLCKLNWERRFDFMQQHSAEHIVSGVAHRLYGCENVGFHLGADIVTLDFDKSLTFEQVCRIEKEANEAVFLNVAFKTYYPDEDTLKALSYRSKKELSGAIRIVEIEGTDVCACCAPHVRLAGQIGLIKLAVSEKIRGGIRLELKAGGRALEDYSQKQENTRKISALLCVKQNETAEAVERLLEQIAKLKGDISVLKRKMLEEKLKSFKPQTDVTAEFEDGLEIKELQHFADAFYRAYGGIRGVFSPTEQGFSFAICGNEAELLEFFARFKAEFSVKGGGRGCMVQGNLTASKEELERYFSSYPID